MASICKSDCGKISEIVIFSFVIKLFLLCIITIAGVSAKAYDWHQFLDEAREKAPEIRSLRLQNEITDLEQREIEATYDWFLVFDIGQDRDRQVSLTNRNFDLEKSDLISAGLKKSFFTGTDIMLDLKSESLESTTTFLAAPRDGKFHSYLFTLEQNLWKNAFGLGSRAQLKSGQLQSKISQMQAAEAIEATLLKGADVYWKAAIANRRLVESEAALKRYEGLVRSIERKSRVRYAAPGELSQVRAEYFGRQRMAKINQVEFDQALLNLKVFLPSIQVNRWALPQSIPQYSSLMKSQKLSPESTRAYLLAEIKKQMKQLNYEATRSFNKPQLAFVGQVGATGVDASLAASQDQMIEGGRPYWYMGLRLSHSFGSDVYSRRVQQARAEARAEEIKVTAELSQITETFSLLERNVQILENNLRVQQLLLESRRQTVQELTKTFNQGRTDISILIDAINRAEEAEVEQVRVRAELELVYLQWQALTDQLPLN